MKRPTIVLVFLLALVSSAANAAIISYWNENKPALPSGPAVFGYRPVDFPEPATFGTGSLSLANFDTTVAGPDGAYSSIQSFAGTTNNAQFGDVAGGSLSPTGGPSNVNNGMQILFSSNTTGYSNISVSWAQRGTSTGFTSRVFAYSTDGGGSFTNVAYTGDSGVPASAFPIVSPVLTGITALENNPNVVFRLTLTGATGASGNNRFDNILVQGDAVPVPEPASAGLAVIVGLVVACVRRRYI